MTALWYTDAAFALALILGVPSAAPAAAQQAEKPDPSVSQLEAAVKRRPSDPTVHVALGLAYWDRNDYPRVNVGPPLNSQSEPNPCG